jgi:serine/threonine protein kinase
VRGADYYQRKQELTREKLIASIRELTSTPVDRTLSPDLAARMEGHDLGAKVRIPGIKILRMIGEGATARVYLASRKDDDGPLVVKILRDDVLNSTTMERFMEEYALVERIQSRHVARILGHGKHENNIYLVMEFFEGGDLAKPLGGKPMPPQGRCSFSAS